MLPKFNTKLLNYNLNKNFKARAFHFMNTEILRNHVIGEWEDTEIEGLSPSISIVSIREQLFNEISIFNNKESFDSYVMQIYMNNEQYKSKRLNQEQSLAVIARAILCCSMHFSITYRVDRTYINNFLDLLNQLKVFYKKTDETTIKIFGRLTSRQVLKINEQFKVNETNFVTRNDNENNKTFEQIMNIENNWECITDYLYSGVNVIVGKIERKCQTIANQYVESLILKCRPITYLTRMGLGITYLKQKFDGGNIIDNHSYLQEYGFIYNDFQLNEHKSQSELFSDLSKVSVEQYGEAIQILNNYLANTKYLTTISIAGNISTSDDFIISVKRGQNLESPNSYSCSVNGVVEVYHKDVILYDFADPSDKPSISLKQENFYFENEFNREMTAELGITQALSWVMQGITIFQVPLLEEDDIPNNLIIDVIGRTYTPFKLDQIKFIQKDAIESKENERIFGYQLDIFENRKEYFKNILVRFLEIIHSQKDLISFIFVSILFLLQIDFTTIKDFNMKNVSFTKEDISILFTIVLLIITVINLNKVISSRKYKLKKSISLKSILNGQLVGVYILNLIKKDEGNKANIVFSLLSELEFLYKLKNK